MTWPEVALAAVNVVQALGLAYIAVLASQAKKEANGAKALLEAIVVANQRPPPRPRRKR